MTGTFRDHVDLCRVTRTIQEKNLVPSIEGVLTKPQELLHQCIISETVHIIIRTKIESRNFTSPAKRCAVMSNPLPCVKEVRCSFRILTTIQEPTQKSRRPFFIFSFGQVCKSQHIGAVFLILFLEGRDVRWRRIL